MLREAPRADRRKDDSCCARNMCRPMWGGALEACKPTGLEGVSDLVLRQCGCVGPTGRSRAQPKVAQMRQNKTYLQTRSMIAHTCVHMTHTRACCSCPPSRSRR